MHQRQTICDGDAEKAFERQSRGLVFKSRPKTPLVNCVALNKHLYPLLSKLGLERGGTHGFRHHRVSNLMMAGTAMVVIKKWIGHGSEEMVNGYTHLRPDFMQDELARVPDFTGFGPELATIDPFDPRQRLRHDVSVAPSTTPGSSNW
jgi:integrase